MMFGRGSFQLARVFGIRIGVGLSWFFVLFFYIFYFTPYFHDVLGGSRTTAYVVTVASVLSFFVSLILHELGHALVARRNGLQVQGIELWMLGGLTRTSGEINDPWVEFRVAAAGPLVTLAVILVGLAVGAAAAHSRHFFGAIVGTSNIRTTPVVLWLSWLVTLNALVLAINLIPAYPLDGGQLARALVWWRTGDRNRATQVTGRLGQGLAIVGGVLGLLLLIRGSSGAIGLLLVSLFVYQGAGAAVAQGNFGQRVASVTVGDIMDREPVMIPAATSLLDAQEQFFLRYRWPWFAVVDDGRHFLGVVRAQRVEDEIHAGRPALTVGEVLEDDGLALSISENDPLDALLRAEGLRRLGAMVAVDADGVLRGVVTVAQVRRAMTPAASG
jgi:Zn-dependent protease